MNIAHTSSGRLLRQRAAATALACLGILSLAGCRQDMHNQPKFYPQRGTDFYADGRSVRPQVQDTVARGQLDATSYLMTGFDNGKEGDGMPMPVDLALLQRGQERYNIYCTACHSRVGNGGGIVVERGYRPAGNFHTDRLRSMPLGHFYNVIANGYGSMPDYSGQLTVADRWAVVAYIRALQLSQSATPADAAGNRIEKLGDIAERSGLPRNFASDWALPATAVWGTPGNIDNGIPGDPGNGSSNGGGTRANQTGSTTQNTSASPRGTSAPVYGDAGTSENPTNMSGPR